MINQQQQHQPRVTKPLDVGQGRAAPKASGFVKTALAIVLDVTLSMEDIIIGTLQALQGFLDILHDRGFDVEVGLILFRDQLLGEMPQCFKVGTPLVTLQGALAQVKALGGGDDPESSLPAISRALDMLGDGVVAVNRAILHITDAPAHDPEGQHTSQSIVQRLMQEQVLFFATAPPSWDPLPGVSCPYATFCNSTGGTLLPLDKNITAETFATLLKTVIADRMTRSMSKSHGLGNEVSDAMRQMREEK